MPVILAKLAWGALVGLSGYAIDYLINNAVEVVDWASSGSTPFRFWYRNTMTGNADIQSIWFNVEDDDIPGSGRYVIGDLDGLNFITQSSNYAGSFSWNNGRDAGSGVCMHPDTIPTSYCFMPVEYFGADEGMGLNTAARFATQDGRMRIWIEKDGDHLVSGTESWVRSWMNAVFGHHSDGVPTGRRLKAENLFI